MLVRMKKDTRLTFRVSSHLKKDVEAIATREGQSVARICEAFLWPDRTRTKNNALNSSSECWDGLVRSQQTDFCEVRGGSPRERYRREGEMKCVRPKQPGGSIPSFTNSSVTKCCVAMAGDVSRAAQGPILKSTIKNFGATRVTIQSRT